MNIAIIPARKNSKRIKNKNVKNFLSKPILFYPIQECINSKLFHKIIVSSDSDKYLELTKKKFNNCIMHKRSNKNSSHKATTSDLLKEIINYFNFDENNNLCCIYPCNPLLKKNNLKKTFLKFKKKKYDLLFTMAQSSIAENSLFNFKNGRIRQCFNKNKKVINSQFQAKYYRDCGQLYWFNKKHIFRKKNLFSGYIGGYLLDESEYQDINNDLDWDIAKLKYKKNYNI